MLGGGGLMALGLLALLLGESLAVFRGGLACLAVGNGLFKPCVSSMVTEAPRPQRRVLEFLYFVASFFFCVRRFERGPNAS